MSVLCRQILAKFPRLSVEGLSAPSSSSLVSSKEDSMRPGPPMNRQSDQTVTASVFTPPNMTKSLLRPDLSSPSIQTSLSSRPFARPGQQTPTVSLPRPVSASQYERLSPTSLFSRPAPSSPFAAFSSGVNASVLHVPDEVHQARYRNAWVKLSAIAKVCFSSIYFS
jgi:hypothetical protein